jgi:hypothetical protein
VTKEEVVAGFRERMGDTLADAWARRCVLLAIPYELMDLEPGEIESALISAVPPFPEELS